MTLDGGVDGPAVAAFTATIWTRNDVARAEPQAWLPALDRDQIGTCR
jgi:hypothetical protein